MLLCNANEQASALAGISQRSFALRRGRQQVREQQFLAAAGGKQAQTDYSTGAEVCVPKDKHRR
eukprot:6174481-Pleurochrysis_carterae.AAC.3